MAVITVSRQFGSGGAEIAKLIAKQLGWAVVDNEFVDLVSQRSGLPHAEVERLEERVPGLLERLARKTPATRCSLRSFSTAPQPS